MLSFPIFLPLVLILTPRRPKKPPARGLCRRPGRKGPRNTKTPLPLTQRDKDANLCGTTLFAGRNRPLCPYPAIWDRITAIARLGLLGPAVHPKKPGGAVWPKSSEGIFTGLLRLPCTGRQLSCKLFPTAFVSAAPLLFLVNAVSYRSSLYHHAGGLSRKNWRGEQRAGQQRTAGPGRGGGGRLYPPPHF